MTLDIRDARFYIVEENATSPGRDVEPLEFDVAMQRARNLSEHGAKIQVLYSREATQTEITQFLTHGIPASLVSGA